MSETLASQFSLHNRELDLLNHKFGAASLGIRIWSIIESCDTELEALTSDNGGEVVTILRKRIVEGPSATISTMDVLIEEEYVRILNTDHVGTARFANKDTLRSQYCEELKTLIESTSAGDRAAHHGLITSIMTGVQVEVQQFYQMEIAPGTAAMRVWSERPTLQDLLEHGPRACLKRRLQPTFEDGSYTNGNIKPAITIRHATESSAPTVTVARTPAIAPTIIIAPPSYGNSPELASALSPETAPESSMMNRRLSLDAPRSPKTIHTRRSSLARSAFIHESIDRHTPGLGDDDSNDLRRVDEERPPQRARTYQTPSKSLDRFRWVHVPYTHAGWVPAVLASVAREKGNKDLHQKLLSTPIWMNHHNRSRHASTHARFVRSCSRILFPKGILDTPEI